MSDHLDKPFNLVLVVLYKLQPGESPTLQSFVQYVATLDESAKAGYRLCIWDNSPVSCEDAVLSMQSQFPTLSIQYIHTPENTPLSKVYNQMAEQVAENAYLTLFDQDTSLPREYFEELCSAQCRLEPLILPKVMCQGLLVSPGTRFYARGRLLRDIPSGRVKSKNLLAINSGMSIHGKVLRAIKYDERLRFYGTDTYFMKNYEKFYDHAFVLETPLSHSLAEMEERPKEWHVAHAKEKFRAFNIIFSDSVIEILFVRIYAFFVKSRSFVLGLIKKT